MARPKKKFSDPKRQAIHEAALARRREKNRERRTMEMAAKAAEGETDFAALVEAEKQRVEEYDIVAKRTRAGGKSSPKVTTKARDNLDKAFDLMGGVAALVVWGRQNPTDFYRIWSRLIPREVAEATTALPLESLLEKLASKEEKSVGQAAMEIGEELLEKGRREAEIEDLTIGKPDLLN